MLEKRIYAKVISFMKIFSYSHYDVVDFFILLLLTLVFIVCSMRKRWQTIYSFALAFVVLGWATLSFLISASHLIVASLMGADREVLIAHWTCNRMSLIVYTIFFLLFVISGGYSSMKKDQLN